MSIQIYGPNVSNSADVTVASRGLDGIFIDVTGTYTGPKYSYDAAAFISGSQPIDDFITLGFANSSSGAGLSGHRIRLTKAIFYGQSPQVGVQPNLYLYRRTSPIIGGTFTPLTIVTRDTNAPSSLAFATVQAAPPTTLGSYVNLIRAAKWTWQYTGSMFNNTNAVVWTFEGPHVQPLYLDYPYHYFTFNAGNTAGIGTVCASLTWTEE